MGADEIPDRALQQALEFAVLIAAAGRKMRPAVPSPAGLRPYLKFHKLPPAALAAVRDVVEHDDDYRRGLARAASPDLVDEVGRLWLQRPDGWQAQALAALTAVEEPDDGSDARREQRRRVAAEDAAARARLEIVALDAQLAAERAATAAAEAAVERLTAEVAALRQQRDEARRAADKRGSKARAGEHQAAAAGEEVAALRAELAAAVEARDAALADRAAAHSGAPEDIERVRALLVEALAATRPAAPRARRRARTPIPVPGGLYGNSDAAAEHLLRTPGVVVLVDGYNVAMLGWPAQVLEQQRARCIEAAEQLARRWGTLLHVVFDGASVVGAAAPGRRLVRVSFSPEGVSADDVLRAEVAALEQDRPVVVVTNDQAIAADVRAAGGNVIASGVFLAVARR